MKNIMRRTVAFMLMACLLLSVMAPTAFAAETTVTYSGAHYDFGTADGSSIAYSAFSKDLAVTEDGNATLYSWSTNVLSTRQSTCKISNEMFGFRGNSNTYYVALKLTGIPDMDATYTLDVRTMKSHSAAANIYLLAGNKTVDEVAKFASDGFNATPDMTLTSSTTAHTDTEEIDITADMVHEGSVIMVLNAPSGTGNNIWLNYMTLTCKVVLTADVKQNIVVGKNAVLDLNGRTVTGNVSTTGGQIVDNVGDGGVVGEVVDFAGNEWLPLKGEDNTYKFFAPTKVDSVVLAASQSKSGYEEHWFDVELSDKAYELIAAGNSGMQVNVDITWEPEGWEEGDKLKSLAFVYAGDAVKAWVNGELGGDEYGLCVKFETISENISDVKIKVTYTANGASVVYTSAVAANG